MEKIYSLTQPRYSAGTTLRRLAGGALLAALLGGSLAASAQSGLAFNGSSSYVQTNTVTLSTTTVSMEAWVKVTAFKTTSPYISSVMGVEDGNNSAMLRFGDATIAANKLQFVLTLGTAQQKVTSTTTFSTNTWYHVAGTYDGTTMRLYVNGVLDNSYTTSGTVAGTGVFYLGRNYENIRILNGSIDEARLWTRTLTAAEIQANACSVSPSATGLEAYWSMNEGTGTTTADRTTHAHNGTFVGTPTWTTALPTQCATTTATHAANKAAGLEVQVLGNPAHGNSAELALRGLAGQPTTVQLIDMLGAVVSEQVLKPTAADFRSTIPLPGAAGLYVVRASSPSGSVTTKLLKQ